MQDHRQKISVFNSSIGSEEQMRALEFTKRKLEAYEEKRFYRSSEADVIRSTLIRSCSLETDIIKGSEDHPKLEDWKLHNYVKCCFNHTYHCRRIEAWSNR